MFQGLGKDIDKMLWTFGIAIGLVVFGIAFGAGYATAVWL